jgi:hypothetical protein
VLKHVFENGILWPDATLVPIEAFIPPACACCHSAAAKNIDKDIRVEALRSNTIRGFVVSFGFFSTDRGAFQQSDKTFFPRPKVLNECHGHRILLPRLNLAADAPAIPNPLR